ncbi:MAG: exosortase H-associated membrane protein [Candidatus Competibacter denitrificans]|jgi:hypothetical protein
MMVLPKPSSLLGRFFLAALFWLPVWFAIWYYAAPIVGAPVVWLSRWVLDWITPGVISEVLGYGKDLHFATTIPAALPSNAPAGSVAEIVVPVNLLKYSWNLPVLMALLFAADERFFSLGRMVVGYLALLPFQAWGVIFEVLKVLSIQLGPEIAGRVGISPWGREVVALGYQFGYLMLPVIAASSVWMVLNRSLINTLLSAGRDRSE